MKNVRFGRQKRTAKRHVGLALESEDGWSLKIFWGALRCYFDQKNFVIAEKYIALRNCPHSFVS